MNPICAGHSSVTGKPCKRHANDGMTVCNSHGGRTPQAKRKAAERIAVAEAFAALNLTDLPSDVDPLDAVAVELGRCTTWLAWLDAKISGLPDDQLVRGVTRVVRRDGRDGPATETVIEAKEHVWVVMAGKERARLLDAAKAASAMGIEHRRVEIEETKARILITVLQGVLADLGVDGRDDVPQIVRRHLLAATSLETTLKGTR